MKNKRHRFTQIRFVLPGLGLLALLTACGPKSAEVSAEKSPLDSIQVLDTKPTDALSVKAARQQIKPGDEVVVHGQIGGVDQPFLDGYAGFVLGDTDIMFCDEMGDDDHCPTPWDACCEDTDKLAVSRASVQFVDAKGQILPVSMKGFSGLNELDHVVVRGKVASQSTAENLIIEARSLYAGE